MIRVARPAEPADFDARCRRRGRSWLAAHRTYDRPHDYWTEFKPALQDAFGDRCAYCAMWIPNGEVDHFTPISTLKRRGEDRLAYEWSNLRYSDEYLNKKKGNTVILDPHQVRDEWFELLLPSLQLVLTPRVPKARRAVAEQTLRALGLDRGEAVMRPRREWFRLYREEKLTLEGLREMAPLLARAVEIDLGRNRDWRAIPLFPSS